MTERIRTVRSGIVGLDLALGGGLRFVRRLHGADQESAIILVRGGPGTGKSVLAQDLALRVGSDLRCDVLYLCVEVLPTEVYAQRVGFDDFDPAAVVDLSEAPQTPTACPAPRLLLGMHELPADTDDHVPDLGGALLDLARIAAARGYAPKVVVVDSLSEGYSLGSAVPRPVVDGLCKMAIEQGWVLILIEEATNDTMSPWTFAVDTVLSLRLSQETRRELVVTKHRFGACEPGPHRLLVEPDRLRVIPPFAAWRNAARYLQLPPSATDRSLSIPLEAGSTQPEHFLVPDGQGRCVFVSGGAEVMAELDIISGAIGRTATSGGASTAGCVTLAMEHGAGDALDLHDDGFRATTLSQFVDGEDWLESAAYVLSVFSQRYASKIARTRVISTDKIDAYRSAESLKRAVSILAELLYSAGHIVVLCGKSPLDAVHGAMLTDYWVLEKTQLDAGYRLKVLILRSEPSTITLIPQLPLAT